MAKGERTGLERAVRVLIALLLLSLMALAGYSQYVNQTFFPEGAIASALAPVTAFFSNAADYVADSIASIKLRGNIEAEYDRLHALNEQLMYRALFAEELQDRNDYLRELLDEYNMRIPQNPLHARVIWREPGNWFSKLMLNKGAKDGVKANMAVITPKGMVGNVVEVFENSCTVITIIDSNFKIGGLIVSSQDQGVVGGTLGIDGTALCRMYYLPAATVPRPGDMVVTSGVGLAFPKNLLLGTVRESTRLLEENKYYIVVEPTADFQHIEDVLILRYEPTIEIKPEGETDSQMQIVSPPTARPQSTFQNQTGATLPPLPNAPGRATPSPSPPPFAVEEGGLPAGATQPPAGDVLQPG